jgi:hypothetical protein
MLASLAALLPLYPFLRSTRASTSVTIVVDGADESLRRANSRGMMTAALQIIFMPGMNVARSLSNLARPFKYHSCMIETGAIASHRWTHAHE